MPRPRRAQPLLIVGAAGSLGQAILAACANRGIRVHPIAAEAVADPAAVAAAFEACAPWAVIDARLRRGPPVGSDSERLAGPAANEAGLLAAAGAERSVPLVVVSSALVVDGAKGGPYVESDPTTPAGDRGHRHAALEATVGALYPEALIVRAGSPIAAGSDLAEPLSAALARLAAGHAVAADAERPRSYAGLPDLAEAVLDLLIDDERGLWHLAHPEPATRADLLRLAAARAGLGPDAIALVRDPADPFAAPSGGGILASERGWLLPPLEDAIARALA